MDSTISNLLNQVTAVQLILAIAAIFIIGTMVYTNWNKIYDRLFISFKHKEEQKTFKSTLKELESESKDLKNRMKKYEENRTSDRQDSIMIRNQLNKDIQDIATQMSMLIKTVNSVTETVNDMSQNIKQMQKEIADNRERNEKSKRTDIKSKIERLYSECSPIQSCTDMQFETLKELIEDYENHGGENSFVHSIVQKEMYKWKRKNNYRE